MNKYIIQNDESGKQFILGLANDNDIFEWQGEKREVGDVVELGKDFKWGLKAYCPPMPETEEDYQMALHDAKHELPPSPKKVAIPLSKADEVKEKEDGWTRVEDKLPSVGEKFKESDYVLAIDQFGGDQVVCWYSQLHGWRVAHYRSNSEPINVTHWRLLPPPPKS